MFLNKSYILFLARNKNLSSAYVRYDALKNIPYITIQNKNSIS